jgi:hypothetical protein
MGWLSDIPGHEGYLVGLERVEVNGWGQWRELTMREHDAELDRNGEVMVLAVQFGCDCGWRSPRIHPPLGTKWSRSIVLLPSGERGQAFEDRCVDKLWKRHVDEVRLMTLGDPDRGNLPDFVLVLV